MALPKRRKSHARVRTRRAQWKATAVTLTKCPNCAVAMMPHRACLNCGQYNGRAVLPPRKTARPDAQ
ncbi:MAG TPA: 50S ribosomal protein L32 [Abditibacterium sp.]|jgi:large subunit ribosomal protein L32